jgi:hypothetical protein
LEVLTKKYKCEPTLESPKIEIFL